jgi:pyruvate formate lyase activating enzyme
MHAYLSKKQGDKVKCLACAHECLLALNARGKCFIRKNINNSLVLEAYGASASFGVDVIEKKPLYHFLPGSLTFSFGTLGCNFKCFFCQNHEISMPKSFSFKKNLSPTEAVSLALFNNCKSISYTYNEPLVFAEYALDTAHYAKSKSLKNILVTNGFFSKSSLELFSKVIDAVNIDLKSFSDDFYKEHCKASLLPVLRAIKFFHKKNIWVEITTLLIPGLNDSEDEIRNIAKFIASVNRNIPWHISRFFPMYKAQLDITPIKTLELAKKIGEEVGLNFMYIGNVPEKNITLCVNCGASLIVRGGSKTLINIKNNKCVCGHILKGVF